MQRPARYSGRLLSKLGRGLSDFCALFFLEPLARARALPQRAPHGRTDRGRAVPRLRDDESTAARLLGFERRKLITVKRINNWAHKEVCSFFCGVPSSHAYSLRHPFLNCLTAPMSNPTKIGGQEPSEPPSAEPPSAETADSISTARLALGARRHHRYIYTPLQKFDREWPGNFARTQDMCGSIETYLQMRGAAFRP